MWPLPGYSFTKLNDAIVQDVSLYNCIIAPCKALMDKWLLPLKDDGQFNTILMEEWKR